MARSEAVVIGCSAGGLKALATLLKGLLPQLPVPIIIVSHTGAEDIELFCQLLARSSPLPVVEARERQRPLDGTVYVAPAGYHLYLERDGHFSLSVDARVCYTRPAIDPLFESASECYRERLLGVVLTGANEDGAAGLVAIRKRQGIAIVQEPAEAEASIMPAAALRLAGADHVAPLAAIASLIHRYCLP